MQVTVGTSGTGGGFEKFCAGETDISDASRPIKDDEEAPVCEKAGVKYNEVQIANDGIAVATNKELAVDCLTIAQLKKLWNKGSKVASLADVDRKPARHRAVALRSGHRLGHVRLLHRRDQRRGGGHAARTTRPPRTTTSSSPASPATRAASATSASPTTSRTRTSSTWSASATDGGSCVKPSAETIQDGSYKPLSRPLFMYPSDEVDRAARGEGVHGVRRRQPGRRSPRRRKIVPLTDEQADQGQDELAKAECAGA